MSLSNFHPNAPYAAEQMVNAIEFRQSEHQMVECQTHLLVTLGGRLDLYGQMTESGRLLYLLALVVKGVA